MKKESTMQKRIISISHWGMFCAACRELDESLFEILSLSPISYQEFL